MTEGKSTDTDNLTNPKNTEIKEDRAEPSKAVEDPPKQPERQGDPKGGPEGGAFEVDPEDEDDDDDEDLRPPTPPGHNARGKVVKPVKPKPKPR